MPRENKSLLDARRQLNLQNKQIKKQTKIIVMLEPQTYRIWINTVWHYIHQCCGSGMLIRDPEQNFFHPGSSAIKIPDPGSGSASKNVSIFNQKIVFKSSRIRILIFTHPGSRGQKGTGSRILIRNTDFHKTIPYRGTINIFISDIRSPLCEGLHHSINLLRLSYWRKSDINKQRDYVASTILGYLS
jgi:hypothetical protein